MITEAAADRVEQAGARVGSVLDGRWSLESLLGIGGMAAVYAASAGQERAAIKVLHPDLTRSQRALDRFQCEGDALRAARHPAVPRVHGEGTTDDGCPYLVMDLLLGETLETRRRRFGGRLAPAEVAQIALVLLDVLVLIHDRGLLHRDVKPSNVLWLDDGSIRLIDFGIAKAPRGDDEIPLTRTGALPGSLGFMSPEHALGVPSDLDPRSDLWSLGATMFLLLSGRPVHESATEVGALAMSATQKAPSLGSVASGLPAELVSVVDRALAFDREERFADAAEMRDALLGVSRAPMRSASKPRRGRRMALSAVALVAIVFIGAAGAGVWSPWTTRVEERGASSHVAAREASSTPAMTSRPPPMAAAAEIVPVSDVGTESGSMPGTEPPRPRAARVSRRAPEQADASAGSASASVLPPQAPHCDPPFVLDPTTGTRRVKPGC